jgi:hypothetical protein
VHVKHSNVEFINNEIMCNICSNTSPMQVEEYFLMCLMFTIVFATHSLLAFRSNPIVAGNPVGGAEKNTPALVLRIRIKDTP